MDYCSVCAKAGNCSSLLLDVTVCDYSLQRPPMDQLTPPVVLYLINLIKYLIKCGFQAVLGAESHVVLASL